MSRPRRGKPPGNRPRVARANTHSSATGGIARLTEDGLRDRLAEANALGEAPLLLILDGVQDPHNLGACLRSAEGAGALAVIVPRHHAAPVTETVVRIACGAAEHVPVVSVGNLARFMGVCVKNMEFVSSEQRMRRRRCSMRATSPALWRSSWGRKGRGCAA